VKSIQKRALLSLAAFMVLASAASHAASLLVLNKEDATLSVVDPATGATRATVPTGAGPHEVEVSADGKLAFVGNYGSQTAGNTLSVIDISAARELRRVDLGELKRPHGLAVAGQTVYFTSEDSQQVARYDASTNKVDWKFSTGQQRTHMALLTRDGRTVITTNMQSDNVSFIDRTDTGGKQTLVATGKGPEGMDLSPDGRQLWAANSGGGSVSIVDVATRKLVRTFDIGTQRSNRLKFTPDGKLALVSDLTAGELVVIDVPTQTVKQKLPIGRGASGILVVPDGSRAYVASAAEGKLAVVDLKTLKVTGAVSTGRGPDGMAWVK
jgi:YVTN family beta-propeller protein